MKKFSVKIKVFKYSKFKWEEEKEFLAEDREYAKEIAKNFAASTEWAFDLTPKADLRTIKQIKD